MYDPKCETYVKSDRKKNIECDFRSYVILWIKNDHKGKGFPFKVADHMLLDCIKTLNQ